MTIRFSKLVGIEGRIRESREDTEEAESFGPPSSLPGKQAPTSGVVTGAFGDAYTAPTMRPPAPPSEPRLSSSPSVSVTSSVGEGSGSGGAGFTSVIRHLSLRGWLRWVHSNRSDATLRIRTWEGGSGRIWCRAGTIIDAEWDGQVGEEAMHALLTLSSGAVTIDFDPVEHPCRVVSPTHELLHVGESIPVRAVGTRPPEAALAPPTATTGGERFRPSALLPSGSAPAPASSESLRPKSKLRRFWRGDYFAGVLVLAALAVAAFAFGRLSSELAQSNAREQSPTQQTRSGLHPPPAPANAEPEPAIVTPKPRELPLIAFVPLEVEPDNAEIWLDRELVGRGRVQLGAIHDGMMHELRFVAPEHETKTLFFRDAPPAGRVVLKRIDREETAGTAAVNSGAKEEARFAAEGVADDGAPSGENETAKVEGEPDAPKKVLRRRPATPAPAPARARPVADEPASEEKPALKRPPQVQLIEVHTPKVQVLD